MKTHEKRIRRAGVWQPGNGDFAKEEELGMYEQIHDDAPKPEPRCRIEHCTPPNDSLLPTHACP